MFSKFKNWIKSISIRINETSNYLKKQSSYELINVSVCKKSGKHLAEIKISGKSQSITYLAEEIAKDDNFIMGFSAINIRTIDRKSVV